MNSINPSDFAAAAGAEAASLAPQATIGPFLGRTRIAYFSMEIATRPDMHTYSGGLGILAGDTARSCADLGIPAVFVTLISRQGYLRQEISPPGEQIEHPDPWRPEHFATPLRAKVAVILEGREVWVRPWLHLLASPIGQTVPVLLLDTDLDENAEADRRLTDHLYGRDQVYRLKQEAVLGIGGLRCLQALGFNIRAYHLNEGHAAFLALDLLRRYPRPEDQVGPGDLKLRDRAACATCASSPRTRRSRPGMTASPTTWSSTSCAAIVETDQLRLLGGRESLNMTRLALQPERLRQRRRRAATPRRATLMFPGYKIQAITNGVHLPTWTHPAFAELFNRNFPAWGHEPDALVRADQLSDEDIWQAHARAKADLIAYVARLRRRARSRPPHLGFARRMTAYKRPDLLFSDLQRLASIAARHPFQLVLAGKAHPSDGAGKGLIRFIHEQHATSLRRRSPVVFLPNYDMSRRQGAGRRRGRVAKHARSRRSRPRAPAA